MNKLLGSRWLNERNFFLLACLLCGLPVWLPDFPPMADLPQHAAQISLYLNLGNLDFPYSDQFELNLFTPYLLGYFLVAVLTPLLGIVAACKLVVWLALAAFALSTRFLLRQTGADPYWAWLTFPVLYGFAYQWGLLNYVIAAPVGIYFLGLVWQQVGNYNWRSSLLIALMLHALFFSHALIMALCVLIASAYWLFSSKSIRDFIKYAWPAAALIPIVLIWIAYTSDYQQAKTATEWDLSLFNTTDGYYTTLASWANPVEAGWGRLTGFMPRMLGERPDLFVTLLGIFLFALPFIAGGRISKSWTRFIPLLFIILLIMFLPSVLRGNSYTFQRFTLLVMPLFLIAINAPSNPGQMQRYLRLLAPVIAFGWIAHMSVNALQFDKEADGFKTVLSKMEPHKRAVSLIFSRDDTNSISPTLMHFPAWYTAVNSGISNPGFAMYTGMPVSFKKEYVASFIVGYAWYPQLFDWQKHEGTTYDYFIVRADKDVSRYIFRKASCRIRQVNHSGQWWLYERDPAC